MDEIAVAGVQLDGVEARLGGARGRRPESRHDRLDLGERELARRLLDVHGGGTGEGATGCSPVT